MDNGKLASAFNLWMDDFINNPEAFAETNRLAQQHLRERLDGKEPTYGDASAATLQAYLEKV